MTTTGSGSQTLRWSQHVASRSTVWALQIAQGMKVEGFERNTQPHNAPSIRRISGYFITSSSRSSLSWPPLPTPNKYPSLCRCTHLQGQMQSRSHLNLEGEGTFFQVSLKCMKQIGSMDTCSDDIIHGYDSSSHIWVLIYFDDSLFCLGTCKALRPRPFTPTFQGSLHLQRTTGAASPANHLGSPKNRNLRAI